MFKRIVLFFLLPMTLLALFLSLGGVQKIELDNTYYNLLKNTTRVFESWSFQIPNIPQIPLITLSNGFFDGLNYVVNFLNYIVVLINVFIQFFNVIINMVQFVISFFVAIIKFRGELI